MNPKAIECEAFVDFAGKKDCAFHYNLGWSYTNWHVHNRSQLIVAEHGVMRLQVADKTLYIPSHYAAWIPEGVEHRVYTESDKLIFRTLYLDCHELTHPYYKELSVFKVKPLLREMILYTEKWPMVAAASQEEQTFLASIKLILPSQAGSSIFLQLPSTDHPVLIKIIEFLEKNYSKALYAKEVALQVGISERSLARLFQACLQTTFSAYLRMLRIAKATELLLMPGANVSDVAFKVGYDSLPTFSNTFLDIVGQRPADFLSR